LVLTEYEFTSGVAHQAVKKSKHEVMNRELWNNTEYVKMREYISNRKFVHVIEELQGLVVSRLMELDKMNLAGSGM